MSYIHSESYRIRVHEIDTRKKITVPAIIQIMQEASMQHIIKLGASVWDLEVDQKSWVLIKKEVEVFDRPGLNELINIKTYPSGFQKFFAYRDYYCYNNKGTLVAQASSCWVLVDVNSKQISHILPKLYEIENPSEQVLPRPTFKIPDIKTNSPSWTHRVSQFELDWNHHLNNSHLNKIILSACPSNEEIKHFQVSYKSEAFENDILEVFTQKKDNAITLKVMNANTEKLVAIARVN